MTDVETGTRDIAVEARTNINSHIADCVEVRERNEKKLDKIEDKLDKISWYIPLIIGGVIVLAHAPDWVVAYTGVQQNKIKSIDGQN